MATGKALFTLVGPKHVQAEGVLLSQSASEFPFVLCAEQNSFLKCVSVCMLKDTGVFLRKFFFKSENTFLSKSLQKYLFCPSH
jgi:hypothetical protein